MITENIQDETAVPSVTKLKNNNKKKQNKTLFMVVSMSKGHNWQEVPIANAGTIWAIKYSIRL